MRPVSPAAARVLLGAIVAAFVALAVNASLLLPLWEPADEHEHWLVVEHWLAEGRMPDLTNLPAYSLNEGVQPPLAYWMFAAGAHATGLADTRLLARRLPPGTSADEALFLHGADEIFPFAGPARRFHLLRLLDVLCGAATVCGAFALGRALAPAGRGLALGAAAVVAFNPAFVSLCGALSNDPLAVALSTASLLRLARLLRDPAPTRRGALATGALIGLAHMAKLSALFLLPVTLLALLLRRPRGEPWRATRRLADGLLGGFAAVTGLYFAWNLAHYGDPFGWSVMQDKFGGVRTISTAHALLHRFLPELSRSYVARLASNLQAPAAVPLAFGALALGAPLLAWLPAVRRRMRAAGVDGRVALLCLAAVGLGLAASARFFVDFNQPNGRYMHPTLPALACLVAACWCWLPRPVALAGGAALALLCFHAQVHVLGPAFWPPSRARDPHFMAFDPLAHGGEGRRPGLLRLLAPPDGAVRVDPPELRWPLPDDPGTRYTVHLRVPGLLMEWHSYERYGLSARDRFQIPADVWTQLPPGVGLVAQVIRLPTLDQALAAPDGAPDVEASPEITLRRALPPAR